MLVALPFPLAAASSIPRMISPSSSESEDRYIGSSLSQEGIFAAASRSKLQSNISHKGWRVLFPNSRIGACGTSSHRGLVFSVVDVPAATVHQRSPYSGNGFDGHNAIIDGVLASHGFIIGMVLVGLSRRKAMGTGTSSLFAMAKGNIGRAIVDHAYGTTGLCKRFHRSSL